MRKIYWSNTRPDSALQVMRPSPAAEVRPGQSVFTSKDGVQLKNFKIKCALRSTRH